MSELGRIAKFNASGSGPGVPVEVRADAVQAVQKHYDNGAVLVLVSGARIGVRESMSAVKRELRWPL